MRFILCIAGAAVALTVAAGAEATLGVLDQSADTRGYGATHYTNTRFDWAQTFRVGISGSLVEVDLLLTRGASETASLEFDIRGTAANGYPMAADSPVLAQVLVPPAAVPVYRSGSGSTDAWVPILLGPAAPVVQVGDVLAIVLRCEEPNQPFGYDYYWRSTEQGMDIYSGGLAFERTDHAGWIAETGVFASDQGFRTFVAPIVPEPSSPWLLSTALLALVVYLGWHRNAPPARVTVAQAWVARPIARNPG